MAKPSDTPPADPDTVAPEAPVPDSREEEELTVPAALKSGQFLVVAGLSLLSAGLLIGLVMQSRKLSVRDRMLSTQVNRSAQVQTAMVELQAQVAVDKADTDRLREKFNESTKEQEEMVVTADKLATASAETQKLLDESRHSGTQFQTEMAAAKVASLEQKGIAEVARAETDVMRVQLKQVTDALTQVRKDLAASETEVVTGRERLQKAEAVIANLQKLGGKR